LAITGTGRLQAPVTERDHHALPPANRESIMGSCKPPKTVFTDGDLNELEWVFESVCIAMEGPNLLSEDIKNAIRRRLFMLACNGMTDPNDLRDHLIANVAHGR
jgi:hypothetical protein